MAKPENVGPHGPVSVDPTSPGNMDEMMRLFGGRGRDLWPGYETLEILKRARRPSEIGAIVVDSMAIAMGSTYGLGVANPSAMRHFLPVESLTQILVAGSDRVDVWEERFPGLKDEQDPYLVGFFEADSVRRMAVSLQELFEFGVGFLRSASENVDAVKSTVTEGRHPDYPEAISFGCLYSAEGREIPKNELLAEEKRQKRIAEWLLGDGTKASIEILKFVEQRRFGFMLSRARKHLEDVCNGIAQGVPNPFGRDLNRRSYAMAVDYVADRLINDFGFCPEYIQDQTVPVGVHLSLVDVLRGLNETDLVKPLRMRPHPGLASTREALGAAWTAFLIFDLNQSDISAAREYAKGKSDLTLGRHNDEAKLRFTMLRMMLEASKGRATGLRWAVGASFPSLTCEFGDLVVFEQKLLSDNGDAVRVDEGGKVVEKDNAEYIYAKQVTRKVTMNMLLEQVIGENGEVLWPGLPETMLPWSKAMGSEKVVVNDKEITVLTEGDTWGPETINFYFDALIKAGKFKGELVSMWNDLVIDGCTWSGVPAIDDDKYFSMWVEIMYAGKIFDLLTWPDDKAVDLAKMAQTESFWRKNVKPFQVALALRAGGQLNQSELDAYQAWSRSVIVGATVCGITSVGFEERLPDIGEDIMVKNTVVAQAQKAGFLEQRMGKKFEPLRKRQTDLIDTMYNKAKISDELSASSPSAVEAGFVKQDTWDRWVDLGLVDTVG